ncbi:hypothetical protein [Catellatospora chokoriensis]|uniref:Uncharacterized protein n=1 Tax=Catellatospora chokoriensis TaxID=310353 RepID=A0A8J3JUD5_9ACTN|nr:hypothetical protein [Catellatospora chokoriensis]GIF91247.1 hypothetical protein Cch02nite_46910 [Catellatospora chokoriensis]
MLRVLGRGALVGIASFAVAGVVSLLLGDAPAGFDAAHDVLVPVVAMVTAAVAAWLLKLRQPVLVPVLGLAVNIAVNLVLSWIVTSAMTDDEGVLHLDRQPFDLSGSPLGELLSLPGPLLGCAYLVLLAMVGAAIAEKVAKANAEIDASARRR